MMEKVDWIKAWGEAQRFSQKNARTKSEACWNDYWDIIADEYLLDSVSVADELFYRSIIEFIRMMGLFKDGDTVLDIGCGPGTYSLLFAEDARSVCALDTSARMLKALADKATKRNIGNITRVNCSWEDYAPAEKYDLVFSSMSPAINDTKSMLKMEECARRGCCLVTYGDQAFEYPAIKDLWERLIGPYKPSGAYLYVYPYNILRQEGRSPDIRMFDHEYRLNMLMDTIIEQYTTYFRIFTDIDEQKARIIQNYFKAASKHGIYEYKFRMRLAAICWKVPGEQ